MWTAVPFNPAVERTSAFNFPNAVHNQSPLHSFPSIVREWACVNLST
jgi:hypothetical protein